MNATVKTTPATNAKQILLSKVSPAYWRVTFDNPPLNLMGPEFLVEFGEIMTRSKPTRTLGLWFSTARSTASF